MLYAFESGLVSALCPVQGVLTNYSEC